MPPTLNERAVALAQRLTGERWSSDWVPVIEAELRAAVDASRTACAGLVAHLADELSSQVAVGTYDHALVQAFATIAAGRIRQGTP